MIQYALKCAEGHTFQRWYQSASAYDRLAAAGMVSCAICGCGSVEKAIMAPRVRPGRSAVSKLGEADTADRSGADGAASEQEKTPAPNRVEPITPVPENTSPATQAAAAEVEAVLKKMRAEVEKNSDYVGQDFAKEARAMHLGEAPERAIYGETPVSEAKELIDEGIPVVPLPFIPGRNTN